MVMIIFVVITQPLRIAWFTYTNDFGQNMEGLLKYKAKKTQNGQSNLNIKSKHNQIAFSWTFTNYIMFQKLVWKVKTLIKKF